MAQNLASLRSQQTLTWPDPDLRGYAAVLTPITAAIDRCSIRRGGRERAILIIFRDDRVRFVDVRFHGVPDDTTHIAVGRTIREHQRACCEGRELL
jgi:hypothetical protein